MNVNELTNVCCSVVNATLGNVNDKKNDDKDNDNDDKFENVLPGIDIVKELNQNGLIPTAINGNSGRNSYGGNNRNRNNNYNNNNNNNNREDEGNNNQPDYDYNDNNNNAGDDNGSESGNNQNVGDEGGEGKENQDQNPADDPDLAAFQKLGGTNDNFPENLFPPGLLSKEDLNEIKKQQEKQAKEQAEKERRQQQQQQGYKI